MSAGVLIPEVFENPDQSVSVVHADPTATSKVTVYVAASAVPSGHAVYAWAWNSSYGGGEAIELTLNSAGTEYVGTLSNDASSSLGFLLVQSDDTSANGVTSWPDGWNDSASSKLANSAQWGSSGTALPSGNSFLYVDSSSYKIVSKPSITAPSELTEGTVDQSYDLTSNKPTITDNNNLGSNKVNGNGDSNKSNNKDHQGNNLTAVNSSTVTPKAAITEKQSKKIVTATTGESTLPQTDQQTSSTWSAILGVLLMLAGFFGFSVDSQKREHNRF